MANPAMAASDAAASPARAPATPLASYDKEIVSKFDSANSYEHVRHLADDIGPRLNGTPQELLAAEYIGSVLTSYGFEAKIGHWGPVSTKRVGTVTSPNAKLPGGPNWQMSASTSGKFTEAGPAVRAAVLDAGTGLTPGAFDGAAGKIVFADYTTTVTSRDAIVDNAVKAGAVAVILAYPTGNSAPPTFTLTTAQPTIPVLGGGTAHSKWIRQLLAEGPLTLNISTHEYLNPDGSYVVGTRHAVGDPQGTKAPIVMVGAHIDSVLGGPGAHDDASGNGVSLEFARVISQYPLDKEIRIGGFGGEEGGLLGSRAYSKTLTPDEINRFVGEWQMDMVGTTYEPAGFFALTPDGKSNFVVQSAYDAQARLSPEDVDRLGRDDVNLQNCKLGQSDHQAFFDLGIPSSLFIWLDYNMPKAPDTCESISRGTYTTEPQYHRPDDTMDNVSAKRLQITLDVVGGAAAYNALNTVTINATGADGAKLSDTPVRANCGDGWRPVGTTDAAGRLVGVFPHATCTFEATSGRALVQQTLDVHGDRTLAMRVALPECSSTITGTHRGALKVTSGVTCLDGATVSGRITVSPGASLVSLGSTVNGGVSATGAKDITLCGGSVNGNVAIADGERVRIGGGPSDCAGVTVAGGLSVAGADELLILAGNSVRGVVSVTGSETRVASVVAANTVHGSLSCSTNDPGLTNYDRANIVTGQKIGQCASL
ncbi:M28 family peptidase [Micromonospora avicenniae]|uniref:M28 family peptidase n=1 Tax=Micromonospora avicenniae TaxID=1198245 RepID=UPI00343D23C7